MATDIQMDRNKDSSCCEKACTCTRDQVDARVKNNRVGTSAAQEDLALSWTTAQPPQLMKDVLCAHTPEHADVVMQLFSMTV